MKNILVAITIILFSATAAMADGPGRYGNNDCHKHKTGKTYLHKKDGSRCKVATFDVEKALKKIERKIDALNRKFEGMVLVPTPGTRMSNSPSIKEKACDTLRKGYEGTAGWNNDKENEFSIK